MLYDSKELMLSYSANLGTDDFIISTHVSYSMKYIADGIYMFNDIEHFYERIYI